MSFVAMDCPPELKAERPMTRFNAIQSDSLQTTPIPPTRSAALKARDIHLSHSGPISSSPPTKSARHVSTNHLCLASWHSRGLLLPCSSFPIT